MPRELIEPHKGDKRYVRRDENGRFSESDDVGRSLAADQRVSAKTVALTSFSCHPGRQGGALRPG